MDELEKICVICQKVCKISHKCICCAACNKLIHLKCSKLTIKQYENYSHSNDCYYCKLCVDSILPFQSLQNMEVIDLMLTKPNNQIPFDLISENNYRCAKIFDDADNTKYYNVGEMEKIFAESTKTDLKIFHFNLRSLRKNKEKMEKFFYEINFLPDIIAISESNIKNTCIDNVSLNDYNIIHNDSSTIAGGVAMYLKKDVNVCVKENINFNITGCENLWVEVEKKTGKKIIVGVIYRHPNYNFQEFQKCLTTTLLNFENEKCEYIICGDININLLSSSSNKRVATYIETLLSNGCNSLINNPTRFSFNSKPSLLDHIYTNNISNGKECGICLYDISDHLPVFVMIKNCKSIISNDIAAYTRCMRNFNPELFLDDLNSKLHQIEENILIDNDIENNFQNFISFFLNY